MVKVDEDCVVIPVVLPLKNRACVRKDAEGELHIEPSPSTYNNDRCDGCTLHGMCRFIYSLYEGYNELR